MRAETARLWTTEELAQFLGIPVRTIHQWRHLGKGPKGIRVGRHLRFRHADVEEWLDRNADGPRHNVA